MSWWLPRTAFALLLLVTLAVFLYVLNLVDFSRVLLLRPPVVAPLEQRDQRPLQALYQLEAQAARAGWTPENRRLAGDLWRRAGDLSRAVAYWEGAGQDAHVLRDRAQAYIELQRWADADETLSQLLAALPSGATDRFWAQFQLGLIRAAYDPSGAAELLRAAQPAYGETVLNLLPILEGTTDSLRIGIALADAELWAAAELAFSASPEPRALAYGALARDMQGKDGGSWINSALALAPDDPQVHFIHGLHLRLIFDYAASRAAITRAVALDPENPALYAELGRAYQLTDDPAAAERWLSFAVSLDSSFQGLLDAFYEDEAALLRAMGLIDEAVLPFDAPFPPE